MPRGYARTWRIEYRATTPEMEVMPIVIAPQVEQFVPEIEIAPAVEISTSVPVIVPQTRWEHFLGWLRRGWEVDKKRWRRIKSSVKSKLTQNGN